MLDTKELERRILTMAQTAFGEGVILAVHCERDIDHMSDPVVWVRFVVAKGEMPLTIDRGEKLDFGVRLTLAFHEWNDPAYPVTFFYPESDYRRLFSAAA